MKVKNVGYISVTKKDKYAVEMQIKKIIDYANDIDLNIDCFYIDYGYYGSIFDRPQIKKILSDIKTKETIFNILYVDNSILSNDIKEIKKLVNKLFKCNAKLKSLNFADQLSNEILIGLKMKEKEYLQQSKQKNNDFSRN